LQPNASYYHEIISQFYQNSYGKTDIVTIVYSVGSSEIFQGNFRGGKFSGNFRKFPKENFQKIQKNCRKI